MVMLKKMGISQPPAQQVRQAATSGRFNAIFRSPLLAGKREAPCVSCSQLGPGVVAGHATASAAPARRLIADRRAVLTAYLLQAMHARRGASAVVAHSLL